MGRKLRLGLLPKNYERKRKGQRCVGRPSKIKKASTFDDRETIQTNGSETFESDTFLYGGCETSRSGSDDTSRSSSDDVSQYGDGETS